jgi:hypothetical protein
LGLKLRWKMQMNRLIATLALPVLLAGASRAGNINLKPETVEAWDGYVRTVSEGMRERLSPNRQFLWMEESPERFASVRHGEIVVSPAAPQIPRKVPSGLIHDWIGAAFIPNTTLDEVIEVLRDYARYKDRYKPSAIDSKTISLSPKEDRFSVLLMNKSLILKTALDSEYKSTTVRIDPRRAYGITQSTRIQEIQDYGTADAHKLPVDQGTGLIWRLFSIARYEERNGGVYMEVEALALSREVPFALRWMVDPIVRRVSRSSLTTSIEQTRESVRSNKVMTNRNESPAQGRAQQSRP